MEQSGARGAWGNRNPTGRIQHTAELEVTSDEVDVDNVNVDQTGGTIRPAGNSAAHGLRRLEKAASAGDGNAADLLRRVVNPDDAMTVNGACVAMGWRKPTVTASYARARGDRARLYGGQKL